MAEPRFKPNSYYVIPGNVLNIVWDEICMPYLALSRPPLTDKLTERIGIVQASMVEDESGRSRHRR